jgi:hypothetical protein
MLNDRAHFSKARFQIIFILVGVLLILSTIALYVYVFHGVSSNPDSLVLNSLDVKSGKLILSGSTISSASGYSGYSYRVAGGKLIVKIRYVPFANRWHPSGDFRIVLSDNIMKAIRQVYIYDKGSGEHLIWTRTDQ